MNQQISTPFPTVQPVSPARHFTIQLSSTRRGARLARRLTTHQLDEWGIPHGTDLSDRAALVVAELAANAVTHGRTPGRDFRLTLRLPLPPDGTPPTYTLRIEVTDTRPDRLPPPPHDLTPTIPDAPAGRGLLIVDTLAIRWGTRVDDRLTKTVWAELTDPRSRADQAAGHGLR
ncbi:anti-sigma regulatory factor (Ser/Thr protein kinase) [Streptomyces aurantiacus]|uniref:ATP-binding protein n=1 Tax=Streptomyces aurantiacus TaxID=47760 RepID=UPI00278D4383|nr:ATP-binding protein [Streptomyces aurantiacus]MDQ0777612.1 anti-sigma regulatory factor (Ser/Thr protein kinase) [Streptomyces aurantiacus]